MEHRYVAEWVRNDPLLLHFVEEGQCLLELLFLDAGEEEVVVDGSVALDVSFLHVGEDLEDVLKVPTGRVSAYRRLVGEHVSNILLDHLVEYEASCRHFVLAGKSGDEFVEGPDDGMRVGSLGHLNEGEELCCVGLHQSSEELDEDIDVGCVELDAQI